MTTPRPGDRCRSFSSAHSAASGISRATSASSGEAHHRRARRKHAFAYPTALILPDGQITSCFPKWLVQPLLQKYFCFGPRQITSLIRTVSSQGGAIARRHERGAGCGGRESARRCQGMAGRVDKARELTNGTQTNGAVARRSLWRRRVRGRRSRVVLAPVAGVKFAEASRPDRAWYKPLIRG